MLVEMEIKIIESPVRDAMYFYLTTMIKYVLFFFWLNPKETKDQDFIKFQCISTSGFCHATQAVRHKGWFRT